MFDLDEEYESPAYPEDFHEVEVKDEPLEFDAVSSDLFYHPNSMLIFKKINIIKKINHLFTRSRYYVFITPTQTVLKVLRD